jgi:Lrp/AsnC family transcriptional regulator, regulator for asnA, asnC and gidA
VDSSKTNLGDEHSIAFEGELFIGENVTSSIDSMDRQIISLLIRNARESSVTLGEKLNVDSSTIRRRTQKLVQKGALSFSVNPDPVFLGFQTAVVLAISSAADKVNDIIEELGHHLEVRWVSPVAGRFDILSVIWFVNNESIYDFVTNIVGKIPGVIRTEVFICLGRTSQRVRRSW